MTQRLIVLAFLIDTWLLANVLVPSIDLNPLANDWTVPAIYVAMLVAALAMAGVCAIVLTVLWWRNR